MLTPPPISATLRRKRSKPLQFSSCDSGTAALSSLSHVSSVFLFFLALCCVFTLRFGELKWACRCASVQKAAPPSLMTPLSFRGHFCLVLKLQSRLTSFSPDPCLLKNYLPLVSDFSSGCINFLSSRPTGERLHFIKGVTPMFYSCLYLMLGRRAWLVPLHPPPPPPTHPCGPSGAAPEPRDA